jgi:hypothetical protein
MAKTHALHVERYQDPDTKVNVQRFVHDVASQEQLFYYDSPSISNDGRYIPCWSNVSGGWQIHVLDTVEQRSVQYSQFQPFAEGRKPAAENFPADHPCFSAEYNRVFFHDFRKIFWVDVRTGAGGWIFEAPEGYRLEHLSARGKYLAFSYTEILPKGKLPAGRKMKTNPVLSHRPRSLIMAADIETGDVEPVWGDHSYLCHVEMCPFDDDLILFSDQSWERRQQEIYVVNRGFTEDKRARPVLAGGHEDYRGRTLDYIGHSFFTQDGYVAGQYCEYGNVDARNRFTDEASFNLVVRPDGTGKRKAKFPGSKKPCHVHCQRSDGLWVGDHWIRPDGKMDTDWIMLIRNRFETQELDQFPLLRTNHHWDRPFHPHAWISKEEDKVVLAYNTGKSDNHLAIIEIPESLREKAKR